MMHYVAVRRLILGTGVIIEKDQIVPRVVDTYLKVRYEKLGLMKKVFDSDADEDLDAVATNEDKKNLIQDYADKKGSIKKLAVIYKYTEYQATKILKEAGLI